MELLVIFILSLTACLGVHTNLSNKKNLMPETIELPSSNLSGDPNKEMYVIHAMVYQVGIITNKTEDENKTGIIGNQEAITFYHTNGTNIDLSHIPEPLVTNVTAQRLVGVAPTPVNDNKGVPWTELKEMAAQNERNVKENPAQERHSRDVSNEDYGEISNDEYFFNKNLPYLERLYKRSSGQNDMKNEKSPVKIAAGAAVIPQEAAVQSIAIPPLLTLNNNFSEIPVPIPNTSVVHYAKINTLINHKP